MERLSEQSKRGCPSCDGVHSRLCMRCEGKTMVCDWWHTESGWAHVSELTLEERKQTMRPNPQI